MKRRVVAIAILSAVAFASCRKDSDEAKIYKALDAGVAAIEAGQVGDAMDFVAEDYADDQGNDKAGIRGYLAGYMLRGNRLTIVRRDEKVVVDGNTATATLDTALFQGDRAKMKGVLPERSGTYRFTISWKKNADGDWLITKATYEPISAASFLVNSLD